MTNETLTLSHIIALSMNIIWMILFTVYLSRKDRLFNLLKNKDTETLSSHKLLGCFFAIACVTTLSLGLSMIGVSFLSASLGLFGIKKFEKSSSNSEGVMETIKDALTPKKRTKPVKDEAKGSNYANSSFLQRKDSKPSNS